MEMDFAEVESSVSRVMELTLKSSTQYARIHETKGTRGAKVSYSLRHTAVGKSEV